MARLRWIERGFDLDMVLGRQRTAVGLAPALLAVRLPDTAGGSGKHEH